MKLNSHNEWDKLKEVILGNIDTKPCIPFEKKTNFTKTDLEIIEKILTDHSANVLTFTFLKVISNNKRFASLSSINCYISSSKPLLSKHSFI